MPENIPHTYYACAHNAEECLKNGSFVRRSQYGLGQFTDRRTDLSCVLDCHSYRAVIYRLKRPPPT